MDLTSTEITNTITETDTNQENCSTHYSTPATITDMNAIHDEDISKLEENRNQESFATEHFLKKKIKKRIYN